MSNLFKKSLYVLVALSAVFFSFFYFRSGGIKDQRADEKLLMNRFKEVPVYSFGNRCDETRFDSFDNYFNYNPIFRCAYNPNLPMGDVVNKYKNHLVDIGWTCIYDEYLYQQAAGKKKFYSMTYRKEDFKLNIFITLLPDGIGWNGKHIEASIDKIFDDGFRLTTNQCTSWIGFES